MKATCPHCGKEIDVVTSKELDVEYGLNQNRQQSLRDAGKMPKPWLEYPNRNIYLRADIDKMRANETKAAASQMAQTMDKELEKLSAEEREEVLKILRGIENGV